MKVVDMHCDTVLRIYDEGGSLLENNFDVLKNNKSIIKNDAELKIRVEILKDRIVDLIDNL